jgi:hypothetical protein
VTGPAHRPGRVRPLAIALLVIGLIAEILGIALLAMGRSVAGAMSVLVPGVVLVMLGVVFLGQGRREE